MLKLHVCNLVEKSTLSMTNANCVALEKKLSSLYCFKRDRYYFEVYEIPDLIPSNFPVINAIIYG